MHYEQPALLFYNVEGWREVELALHRKLVAEGDRSPRVIAGISWMLIEGHASEQLTADW
jgi:hypothetical protein